MEKAPDSTDPDFWNDRYVAGRMPWDFGGVPAALKSFLARSSSGGKVLIPGCGSGYEVRAFHEAGYDVKAIDFAPAAVEQSKKVLGALAGKVILGDFFTHDFGRESFDVIYERTFLCSMHPSRWPDYADRIAALLSPGGRLIGFFFYGNQESEPPYPLKDKQGSQLFERNFRLVKSELVTDSLPLFRGMERWQEWVKNRRG